MRILKTALLCGFALFASVTALLTLSNPAITNACAESLVDDAFDGTILNRCKWDEASQGGGQFNVNGQLIATTSAESTYSIPRLTSQYRLTGNFDFQVDYSVGVGWTDPLPGGSQLEIQMGVYWDDSRAVFIGRGKDSGGEYIKPYTPISSQGGINSIRIPTTQISGKFRAVRTGSSLTMKYFDGSAWQDLATATVSTEDAYVYLGTFSGNASRSFTANFDNFKLNSGPTSFHPFVRSGQFKARPDFYVGGVVSDSLAHRTWGDQWQGINPLDTMKQNGFKWARVGVTTVSSSYLRDTPVPQWNTLPWRDEYWSSREYSGELMRQAQAKGYHLNAFLFLSNTAAHAGQQNAPPEWAGLSVAETAQRVEQYSFDTAQYYMNQGLNIELYDVGNEIDFGILNFRPGERIPIPPGVDFPNNMDYMRNSVWNIEAQLLQASINGIKRANPNAKIVLHASGINISRSNVFIKTFFKTMVDYGVQFDYVGLSNPYNHSGWSVPLYSTDCWFQRLQEIIDYCAGLNKKVIMSEASYPHDPSGATGSPMPEFPYTDSGQAAWAREYLRFLSNQPNVQGFYWFYPDYHMNINSDPFLTGSSLFQTPSQPVPAMAEFRVNLRAGAFDFDGDGKTDIGIFRPNGTTGGEWWISKSADSSVLSAAFGSSTDIPAPADYTGDGKADIAFYRPSTGTWYILRSEDSLFYGFPFGNATDIPAPADYDGDGKADAAVFRSGAWYILRSSDGGVTSAQFGIPGDKPVPADFDGDGKADIAIYRPNGATGGEWWVLKSGGGIYSAAFGSATDTVTVGDYTGDGKADCAFFRPSTGTWYILRSEDNLFYGFPFGNSTDTPAPGDYDGDGKTDAAVFRQPNEWYVLKSSGGVMSAGWGAAGDVPVAGSFVR